MTKHFHQCICAILKLIQTFGTIFVVAVSFVKLIAKIFQFLLICVACLDLLCSFFNDLLVLFFFSKQASHIVIQNLSSVYFILMLSCMLFVVCSKNLLCCYSCEFERWFNHRQFDLMYPPSVIGARTNLFPMRELELYKILLCQWVNFKVHSR